MTTWTGPYSRMSRTKGKSPGWAAFDRKHRRRQGDEPELDINLYPPMPNLSSATPTVPVKSTLKNMDKNSFDKGGATSLLVANLTINDCPPNSFSSVVKTLMDVPILLNNSKSRAIADNSSSQVLACEQNSGRDLNIPIAEETNSMCIIEKLKKLNSWAENSLIEDILAGVNNDEDQAREILKAMVSTGSKGTKLSERSVLLEDSSADKGIQQLDQCSPLENHPVDRSYREMILGRLVSVPIEPEWEEDDMYLSHRKHAVRMTRLAVQHSRASSNAFSVGDHFAAKQLSLKAQEEWMAAEKLNAKAAKEILRIRNKGNDVWKLDLHGLHASEAVHALKSHLNKIEFRIPINHSVSSDWTTQPKAELRQSSAGFLGYLDMEGNGDREQPLPRQGNSILQVITGTGIHSRGEAALPAAVRSFLTENGYRFYDARPGVIAVRPKFRHK